MKKFNAAFQSLHQRDFSALSESNKVVSKDSVLFVTGKLFDTTAEVVLKNFISKGASSIKEIDGDFTLIIWHENKLYIIRDRHGVGSQIFYSQNYVSTDLKYFTTLTDFVCKPNKEALFTFIEIGYVPAPMSSLEGVLKLESGHMLIYDGTNFEITDLFPVSEYMAKANTCTLSVEDATDEYERLHKKAIQNRINDKHRIGLLLSGGYDSGGNISALRDIYDGSVCSYSIGFKNNQWTELPLARLLSERYKSKHYDYEIDGAEIMHLPKIIGETGDPFQEGGLLVNYTAMDLVRQSGEDPEIILGGDGNDQHFGTSGKELAFHWKLKSKGAQPFQKLYDTLGNLSVFEKDNIFFRTQFHNRKILYIQECDVFGLNSYQLKKLTKDNYKMGQLAYLQDHPTKFASFDEFYLNRNLNIDIRQVINNVILYKSSRMSTLFGNNMSFPYMSTELYDFLATLPVDYKCHGTLDELAKGTGVSKYLHKRYLKPKLPSEITQRKKQGGFAPLPIFLKDTNQRAQLFAYLRKSEAMNALFDMKAINKLLVHYDSIAQSGGYWFWYQQVTANQVINLLTVAVWWDMYINKKTDTLTLKELF